MTTIKTIQRSIKRSCNVGFLALIGATQLTAIAQSAEPVAAPQNIRFDVYSSKAAELFWDRADDPFTQYNVFRDDELVSEQQFGISYFDASLLAEQQVTFTVVAIDAAGNRSQAAIVQIGGGENNQDLMTPENLSVAVYSRSAAELFWSRQASGQQFSVERDGELLSVTDGTSFYDDSLPGDGRYVYEVSAIDASGSSSSAATVTAVVGSGNSTPTSPMPDTEKAITLANAEFLASQAFLIGGGSLFTPFIEDAQGAS